MKKLLVASAAALALSASSVLAADLAPAPAPEPYYKAPPPVEYLSWTGFYAGLNLGGAWGDSKYNLTFPPATAYPPVTQALLANDGAATLHMSNVSSGGQIGYNWQVNNLVLGPEADIQYMGLRKTNVFTQNGPVAAPIVTPFVFTESSRSDWMATIRGRLGFAAGRVLFYGTGGVAFADSQSADTLAFPTFAPPATFTGTGARSSIQTGWTAGGGIEWAFNDHWTAKAEYLYAQFPTSTTAMTPINTIFLQAYTDRLTVNLARAGVNYKF
jgi:outer membrane immunogenic protein